MVTEANGETTSPASVTTAYLTVVAEVIAEPSAALIVGALIVTLPPLTLNRFLVELATAVVVVTPTGSTLSTLNVNVLGTGLNPSVPQLSVIDCPGLTLAGGAESQEIVAASRDLVDVPSRSSARIASCESILGRLAKPINSRLKFMVRFFADGSREKENNENRACISVVRRKNSSKRLLHI
ncbi:MAG: hypothetical protein K9N62_12185 [Verrucomicrobia bacterium]|nr:hypothetical protein [Verrucomicrobiota bacterium]